MYQVYCQLGLAYDHRIHTCNWPDLLMEYAGKSLSLSSFCTLAGQFFQLKTNIEKAHFKRQCIGS